MSVNKDEVIEKIENDEKLQQEQEAVADEIFGSDEEIAKQAAEAEAEQPDPDSGQPAPDTSDQKSDDEAGAGDQKPEEKAAEGEEKPEEKAEEKPEEKEEDPYKVPEDMKGRTKERFEKLTTDLKESHQQIEKQTDIIKGFRTVLESTGMDSKELQQTLELGGMIKKDPKRALETLRGVVTNLSEQLGEVPPGKDPLEGFEDLKQKIEDRELSPEDAKEIASYRIKQEAEKRRAEQTTRQQTEHQKQEAANADFTNRVNRAQTDVAAYLKEAEKDPDFTKIAPTLVQAAQFSAENLDPDKWLGYIKGEYQKVKEIATAMAPSSPGDSPILDGGAPPGGQKDPENLEQLADLML